MATKTLGTSATSSLTALPFLPGYNSGMAAADVATINNAINNDQVVNDLNQGGWFTYDGQLFVPNRGVLKILPGDWVGVDSQGWPVLISANSIAHAAWTHS